MAGAGSARRRGQVGHTGERRRHPRAAQADALEAARVELTEYFGAGQSFAGAAGPRDLVPVAVSAKPLALQAVVYFPHDVERPIAHLARVPNNVVSGEVDADADQDRAAVRFRALIGGSGERCRQRQSYKCRRD